MVDTLKFAMLIGAKDHLVFFEAWPLGTQRLSFHTRVLLLSSIAVFRL